MTKPAWDARIKRAEELARAYPFASEVLRFYAQIARFQKGLYAYAESACGTQIEKKPSGSLRDELDLIILLPKFPAFLSLIESAGTPQLAQTAGELASAGHDRWIELLTGYWTSNGQSESAAENPNVFFMRAFLQPYGEYLADHTERALPGAPPPLCPLCHGKPQVGVLRPEGDGGKRSLICSFCSHEWDYRRIVCPACQEESVEKLFVYTASQFPHVRVEACETCKTYINTVDLTKNGLAIPEVDELACLPLSLWAKENGYTKLQPNLLGI